MKKKIFIGMLICVVLVIAAVSVYAATTGCSHNNGTAMGLIHHRENGSDCVATERYYCDRCDETFYIARDISYSPCPSWHRNHPNWQPDED